MDNKNIILVTIAILVVALIIISAYIITNDGNTVDTNNTTENNTTNTTGVVMIDEKGNVKNDTVVGDDSKRNDTNQSNKMHRVYNPQSDSYVTVIGEGYDDEVDRWYTYDTDGVRYYNTRIN